MKKGSGVILDNSGQSPITTTLHSLPAIAVWPVVFRGNAFPGASQLRPTSDMYLTKGIRFDGLRNTVFRLVLLAL